MNGETPFIITASLDGLHSRVLIALYFSALEVL